MAEQTGGVVADLQYHVDSGAYHRPTGPGNYK